MSTNAIPSRDSSLCEIPNRHKFSQHRIGEGKRMTTILEILKEKYPNARIVLHYTNTSPWELLVAVILSAQCTDVMVNKVTEKLFQKYKNLSDYILADLHEFENDIKSTGFYHNKAKNILAAASLIKEKFNGNVPQTMDELLTIPGVARKTANVVLGNAYGVVVGIAVDTHVLRLSQRLRLVDLAALSGKNEVTFEKDEREILDYKKDADANKIEQQLMTVIPHEDWFTITYLLIDHGRAICKAQNPDCGHCVLAKLCPSSRV